MIRRWLLYLAALAGTALFWLCYTGWYSGYLLSLVLALPWLSLALSLPAMRRARIALLLPEACARGEAATLAVECRGGRVMPVPRCRLTVCAQQEQTRLTLCTGRSAALRLDTAHCGAARCRLVRGCVEDYLGLFRRRLPPAEPKTLCMLPVPAPPARLPEPPPLPAVLQNRRTGEIEDYELRDYRPGDPMRAFHWKLSAKTDRPIVREPLEAAQRTAVLSFDWGGTPEQLDRTLDRLAWLSAWLLEQGTAHDVRWNDGAPRSVHVADRAALQALLRALVLALPAPAAPPPAGRFPDASWHCHIRAGAPEETEAACA